MKVAHSVPIAVRTKSAKFSSECGNNEQMDRDARTTSGD